LVLVQVSEHQSVTKLTTGQL